VGKLPPVVPLGHEGDLTLGSGLVGWHPGSN
jgi:hypothetical protein